MSLFIEQRISSNRIVTVLSLLLMVSVITSAAPTTSTDSLLASQTNATYTSSSTNQLFPYYYSSAIIADAMKSVKLTARDAQLAKLLSVDPAMLYLEKALIGDYCSQETVKGFSALCNKINKPNGYTACTDFASKDASGMVRHDFTASSAAWDPQQQERHCLFFIDSPRNAINLLCKFTGASYYVNPSTISPAAHVLIEQADNIEQPLMQPVPVLTPANPSATIFNGAILHFHYPPPNVVDANTLNGLSVECSWTTEPIKR